MAGASDGVVARAIVEGSALVIDSLPRAIIVVDRDGRIVAWNVVAERLYGWSRDEAIGQSFYELITPSNLRDAGRRLVESALNGSTWNGNVRILRRSGDTLMRFCFVGPLRDTAGEIVGVVGAVDEEVELQRLESERLDLADHLLLALSAGRLGTWRWDQQSGFVTWDEGMERLFGVEQGSFDGTFEAWVSLLHPDDVDGCLAVLNEALSTRSSYDVEHRVIWGDGSVHWIQGRGKVTIDAEGNTTGSLGCATDVTDRKLSEIEAIDRAQLAEAAASGERLRSARLQFLADLNDLVMKADDYIELMDAAVSAAVPRLGDWCALHFFPRKGEHERRVAHADAAKTDWARSTLARFPYNSNAPFGVAEVMRTGHTEFYPTLRTDVLEDVLVSVTKAPPEELHPIVEALDLTSVLTVPLRTKRGVIGAMQFVSAESKRVYDDNDVALGEAAAARIGEALDNAWLTEQQRMVARTLQEALLPASLPDIPGVSLAVRYWAAGEVSEVGGDFYDVFPIGDDTWALVIGDVCGQGAEAAAVTAIARHTLRAAAIHGASHVQVLNWVNDAILASGTGLFCTVLYSTLERTKAGAWRYTSVAGGHPLPILVDSGVFATHIGHHGTLIGVLPTISVRVTETVLVKGSTLVLHTDGVNDVRPPYGLDDEALAELVVSAAKMAGNADEVAERIGGAIERILPIPEREDDLAVVVLRVG